MGKTKHTEPKQYLSITEAAEFLGVSRPTIYARINSGELPYNQVSSPLVSQDDKTIKSIFENSRARFNEEHQEDLNAFLHDVISAPEAVKDLKSDYRSNTAVIHFIKNPDQPVRVIKRLRDEHFTEGTLLDIFEYKMKYDALQAIIKNQKKSEKHSQSAPTINYQIGVLNNNGTITANSYKQLTAPTTVKQIENE